MNWLMKNKTYILSIIGGIVGLLWSNDVIDEKIAAGIGGLLVTFGGTASLINPKEPFAAEVTDHEKVMK